MWKKKDQQPGDKPENPAADSNAAGEPQLQAGGWDDSSVKIKNRSFPGPAGVSEPLRIAMEKEAYADLVSHAKESVDREICGVLLGNLCQDEHGYFVAVEAAVRGTAAKTGGTHVTFTQETWNQIHQEKDARYPKLQIVGWYHSHPGFGVEFSDMDMFIQKNFFSGPSQIAFVSDPLGGEEAICANTAAGIRNIRRFWVDGRERRCYVPREDQSPGAAGAENPANASAAPASSELSKTVRELEDRVRQLTDAVEKQRNTFFSFLTFLGTLAAGCLVVALGFNIFWSYHRPTQLPEDFAEVNMPMKIDGKDTLVTLAVRKWRIPTELGLSVVDNPTLEKLIAAQKRVDAEDAVKIAAATRATASAPATTPAPQ